MKPYVFHPEAETEYIEAARYYTEVDPVLGVRFFDEVEQAISDVRNGPNRYRLTAYNLRRYLLPHFPYGLLFLDEPDQIWIIAIAPLKRKPQYWSDRINH